MRLLVVQLWGPSLQPYIRASRSREAPWSTLPCIADSDLFSSPASVYKAYAGLLARARRVLAANLPGDLNPHTTSISPQLANTMKFLAYTLFTALSALPFLTGAADATTASSSTGYPKSVDASTYLIDEFTTLPTWATGKYATSLATALYSVETSFGDSDKYTSVMTAIRSAAVSYGGDEVVKSIETSGFNWGSLTTESWYTAHVPTALQTAVVNYDAAWGSAYDKVYNEAFPTSTSKGAAAAGVPRCTGMAQAVGVAAGVAAAVAGVL